MICITPGQVIFTRIHRAWQNILKYIVSGTYMDNTDSLFWRRLHGSICLSGVKNVASPMEPHETSPSLVWGQLGPVRQNDRVLTMWSISCPAFLYQPILAETSARKSNYLNSFLWDMITYSWPDSNCSLVKPSLQIGIDGSLYHITPCKRSHLYKSQYHCLSPLVKTTHMRKS